MTDSSKIHNYTAGPHTVIKRLLKEHYAEALRDYNSKQLGEPTNAKKFAKEMQRSAFEANITDRVVF